MIKAYILTTVEGDGADVVNTLKQIDEVTNVRLAFGTYDFVVEIEAEDEKTIGDLMIDKIRPIEKLTSTMTILTTPL